MGCMDAVFLQTPSRIIVTRDVIQAERIASETTMMFMFVLNSLKDLNETRPQENSFAISLNTEHCSHSSVELLCMRTDFTQPRNEFQHSQ